MSQPKHDLSKHAQVAKLAQLSQLAHLENWGVKHVEQLLKRVEKFPLLKKKLPRVGRTILLSLVTSSQMKKLNKAWRGKEYTTDVLSFPAPDVFFEQGHIGELVICHPVMKQQAKEHGHSLETEFEILLIHGVLHLLGFDHELDARQEKLMQKWEDELMSAQVASVPSSKLLKKVAKTSTTKSGKGLISRTVRHKA